MLQVPLGWLIGALVTTAVISMSSVEVRIVPYGRELSQGLIGIVAGERLTPAVADQLIRLLPLMLVVTLVTILFASFQSWALARLSGVDRRTALFSSLPGGVAEMAVLATRYNGDAGLVSVGQFMRILLVTLTVPQIVLLFPSDTVFDPITSMGGGRVGFALGVLCLVALSAGIVFARLKIPNGWLFAGIIAGGIGGFLEFEGIGVPTWSLVVAQVLIGTALGSRCKPSLLKSGKLFLPLNLMGTGVLILFTVLAAGVVAHFTSLDHASLILALAPGGVAEMSLVATSMHLDVILVVAFHLIRITLIILLSVPLMRIFAPGKKS